MRLHGAGHHGRIVAATVEAAAADLGLTTPQAAQLATAAGAVARAVHLRGFADPADAALHVTVGRHGHRVVVHVDDTGLPFDWRDAEDLDGAVLQRAVTDGWVDEIHHRWRGRDGNRTVLARHLDPGRDLRLDPPARTSEPPEPADQPSIADLDDVADTRLATPDDADGICRLTWRTYEATYQHDEYYQPDRLAAMLADGTQVSFVTPTTDGEIIGHSAILVAEPDAVIVEAGRAMVDPRYRGHHLMSRPSELRKTWFAEHGILALAGAAVTAHTRSQRDAPVCSVLLGFLPPIEFAGIDGTASTVREAVVGGFIPMASIPPQEVVLPERDAEVVRGIYADVHLDRTERPPADPASGTLSQLDVSVRADLGHAVVTAHAIGVDLPDELARRVDAIRAADIAVTYLDLPMDDPAVSWAADRAAEAGWIFAGVLPLEHHGVDVVRYQHLGDLAVDPDAIHLRADQARALLAYVLAQRGATP